jgi:hypothetical protein
VTQAPWNLHAAALRAIFAAAPPPALLQCGDHAAKVALTGSFGAHNVRRNNAKAVLLQLRTR